MEIKTLATGSSGNCYVLTADTGARLMIECGIPWRRIAESMRFNFSRVCGCLISHEHKDHSLAFKDLIGHGIKICASEGTFRELNPRRSNRHEYVLKERVWTTIGDFQVLPLAAVHDAAEPMMFVIRDGVDVLLFATDTQYIPHQIKGLTQIMVEANYRLEVLNGNYIENGDVGPRRRRIINTHLAIETLEYWFLQGLQVGAFDSLNEIHLIHMSRENADPQAFQARIQKVTGKPVFIE